MSFRYIPRRIIAAFFFVPVYCAKVVIPMLRITISVGVGDLGIFGEGF